MYTRVPCWLGVSPALLAICLGCAPAEVQTYAIAFDVAMTAQETDCVAGWKDANNDGTCGLADLSYKWMSDDGTFRYLHPEVQDEDGNLSATLIIETGSLDAVNCNGEYTGNDELLTSHFWLVVVQEDQTDLPEEAVPQVQWTIDYSETPNPDGYVIVQSFTPIPITSHPPDVCVELHEKEGHYRGGGGFQLNLGLQPLVD